MLSRAARLLSALACLAASAPLARADAPVSFKDRVVTLVVGNAAGGGTDLWARLLGKYLAARLPGSPRLVVMNQPGAEGVIALNSFYETAKPDGLNITLGAGTQSDPLFYRSAHAVFDLAKMEYAGGVGRSGAVIIINRNALGKLRDKSSVPVTMGALAAIRPSMYMALWGRRYLGWNLRWVLGYPTTAVLLQALARGEVDMSSFAEVSDVETLTKTGRFEILSQLGRPEGGKRVGLPQFGKAPILANEVEPLLEDRLAREAFAYWKRISFVGTWLGLPPGTPQPIVALYQRAMHETLNDPAFRKIAFNLVPDLIEITGPEIKDLLGELAATRPEVLSYLQDIEKRQGLQVVKKR